MKFIVRNVTIDWVNIGVINMAKRGDAARESVRDTIVKAFEATNNFVTIQDKKIYVTAQDGPGGEVIQFAIAMTIPKTPVQGSGQPTTETTKAVVGEPPQPVDLAPEDKEKVKELMERLGINQ